jgi:hypothetical protein
MGKVLTVSSVAVGMWLLLAAGCGSDGPAAPSGALAGRWSGTITRGADEGTTVWQLTQTGSGVSGTWSADFAGAAKDVGGLAGGTVIGSSVSLFLTPSEPIACGSGITLSGTLSVDATVSGDRLTGTYLVFTCDSVETGNVDVRRH